MIATQRKTPRDYQLAAEDAVFADFGQGTMSAMVVQPTGTGKTVLFSRVANRWDRGNVLILAHRIELLEQAADRLADELGYRPPIEQGERGVDRESLWQGGNIVIGSVQTLVNIARLKKYHECPFGLVIVDECHHATSPSYRKVIDTCRDYNPDCRVLGVTATPHRTDKTALGIVFDSVPFAMDMEEAIRLGWLVDIHQEFVQLGDVDFSNIALTKNKHGERDFDRRTLETILTEETALHAMARPILDTSTDGEQCLIFNAGVAHAHLMADVLNRYKSGSSAAVDGKTDPEKRKQIVEDFRRGKLQYLTNYGVFTEGFDAPNVSRVIMARPTKSVSLYIQMLGRGTRPLPGVVDGRDTPEARRESIAASAKPHVMVLDYVGNSRHKPVSTVDALAGEYDVDVRQLAELRIREKSGNVRDELKKAKADLGLIREESERKAIIAAKVAYQRQRVDVFGHGAAPVEQDVGVPRGGSSDSQISVLVNLGVQYETAAGYTRKQASAVIGKLKETRCTSKQQNILKRFGYEPNVPFIEAAKIIDAIAKNDWRRP